MIRDARGFLVMDPNPPPVRAHCPNCYQSACKCHQPGFDWRTAAFGARPARRRERQQRAVPPVLSNVVERLGEVSPPVKDGLIIEGLATTRDWNAPEIPLAHGLRRLDGSTTTRRRGLDPKKFVLCLPLPLLHRHNWNEKIGVMYGASASDLAFHFKAVIVPPGTPGYDSGLLTRVWAGVEKHEMRAVSFHSELPAEDGTWRGIELSVCPVGGNPYAVITRAVFPNGQLITRSAPTFDLADAQRAWLKFEGEHRATAGLETRSVDSGRFYTVEMLKLCEEIVEKRVADLQVRTLADAFQGTHDPSRSYKRGEIVMSDGSPWLAMADTRAIPGQSPDWKLFAKKGRDGRDRR